MNAAIKIDRLSTPTRRLVESAYLDVERFNWVCSRKKRHRDIGAARAAADRMTASTGVPYEAYECPWGSHYHVGRSLRRE